MADQGYVSIYVQMHLGDITSICVWALDFSLHCSTQRVIEALATLRLHISTQNSSHLDDQMPQTIPLAAFRAFIQENYKVTQGANIQRHVPGIPALTPPRRRRFSTRALQLVQLLLSRCVVPSST